MIKPIICLCVLTSFFNIAHVNAQTIANDTEDVKTVVRQMFDAMKRGDSAMVLASFAPGAIMQTIATNADGQIQVRNNTVAQFASSVSKQPAGTLDEQITFGTISTDRALAIAWTPYKFYFKGTFSHCGVNSFQLVKFSDGWKIQYIIDTRRKEPCE